MQVLDKRVHRYVRRLYRISATYFFPRAGRVPARGSSPGRSTCNTVEPCRLFVRSNSHWTAWSLGSSRLVCSAMLRWTQLRGALVLGQDASSPYKQGLNGGRSAEGLEDFAQLPWSRALSRIFQIRNIPCSLDLTLRCAPAQPNWPLAIRKDTNNLNVS